MIDSEREYLNKILQDYKLLKQKLNQKEVITDLDEYTAIKKKIKKIENLSLLFIGYLKKEQQWKEWKEIIVAEPEFKMEGWKEITNLEKELVNIYQQIEQIQKVKNQNNHKWGNTIMEIRGAAGGAEANLFASDLFNMYLNFCKRKNWKYEIWETNQTESGGYSFVAFIIKNKNAYQMLQHEAGVHRVQRIPKTEHNDRIHTSTATVAILEEKTVDEFPINHKDLRVDTFRSSGAGGQHVNTTDSAVRVTHIPTGTMVACQEGRSQHDNKEKALKVLRARLFQFQQENLINQNINSRNKQIGEGERSEKIRTYNFPQNRVTDHRINWTSKNIEQIINGKLESLLEKLVILNEKNSKKTK